MTQVPPAALGASLDFRTSSCDAPNATSMPRIEVCSPSPLPAQRYDGVCFAVDGEAGPVPAPALPRPTAKHNQGEEAVEHMVVFFRF